MKIANTYLCYACQEIFERAAHAECPKCLSNDISALSWLVQPEPVREAWLRRIHAAKSQQAGWFVSSEPGRTHEPLSE